MQNDILWFPSSYCSSYWPLRTLSAQGLRGKCMMTVARTPEDSDCKEGAFDCMGVLCILNVLLESPDPLADTWLWMCFLSCTSHITATHLWQTSLALPDEGRHLTHNQRPGRKADTVAVNVPYASDEHGFGKLLSKSPSQQFEAHGWDWLEVLPSQKAHRVPWLPRLKDSSDKDPEPGQFSSLCTMSWDCSRQECGCICSEAPPPWLSASVPQGTESHIPTQSRNSFLLLLSLLKRPATWRVILLEQRDVLLSASSPAALPLH